MKELIKPWNDGGNISVTYNGDGDGSAIFSSDVAEGLDREMTVVFRDGSKTVAIERKVTQAGMREKFVPSDGEFILADGGTFNVLKTTAPYWRDYYKEVEYIESSGTQYINTGVYVNPD